MVLVTFLITFISVSLLFWHSAHSFDFPSGSLLTKCLLTLFWDKDKTDQNSLIMDNLRSKFLEFDFTSGFAA